MAPESDAPELLILKPVKETLDDGREVPGWPEPWLTGERWRSQWRRLSLGDSLDDKRCAADLYIAEMVRRWIRAMDILLRAYGGHDRRALESIAPLDEHETRVYARYREVFGEPSLHDPRTDLSYAALAYEPSPAFVKLPPKGSPLRPPEQPLAEQMALDMSLDGDEPPPLVRTQTWRNPDSANYRP